MWENDKNISDIDVIQEVLKQNNFDVASIIDIAVSQDCKDELIKNTDNAVSEVLLVPQLSKLKIKYSFKDHMYQLEEYINSNK